MLLERLEELAYLQDEIKSGDNRAKARFYQLVESTDFDELLNEAQNFADSNAELEDEIISVKAELDDMEYEYESSLEEKDNLLDDIYDLARDLCSAIEELSKV